MQNNEKDGVLLPPTAADIETALKKERDVTAVLITSPDYYGNVADLSAIEKVCRRYNRIFMVDGAHGAYLKFDADARGLYAGECAHIWVDGSHKTMPTLTQGALLNVNDESLLADAAEGLNMFRTTSPSYPVMASIEYGVKYMEENGAALIDAVRRELTLVKAKLRKAGIPFYAESKTLVLAVDFGAMGISPYRAEEELARRGVYAEMCDGRYLLFYFSALTSPVRLRMLEFRLRRIARMRSLKNTYEPPAGFACGVKKFSYLTANSLALEYVPLDKAAGRIAARNAGITPPCFPTVVAGEQITEAAAEALSKAAHTFGVYRGTDAPPLRISGEKGGCARRHARAGRRRNFRSDPQSYLKRKIHVHDGRMRGAPVRRGAGAAPRGYRRTRLKRGQARAVRPVYLFLLCLPGLRARIGYGVFGEHQQLRRA